MDRDYEKERRDKAEAALEIAKLSVSVFQPSFVVRAQITGFNVTICSAIIALWRFADGEKGSVVTPSELAGLLIGVGVFFGYICYRIGVGHAFHRGLYERSRDIYIKHSGLSCILFEGEEEYERRKLGFWPKQYWLWAAANFIMPAATAILVSDWSEFCIARSSCE